MLDRRLRLDLDDIFGTDRQTERTIHWPHGQQKMIMLLAGGDRHHVALQFDVLLIELAYFGGELRNKSLADLRCLDLAQQFPRNDPFTSADRL